MTQPRVDVVLVVKASLSPAASEAAREALFSRALAPALGLLAEQGHLPVGMLLSGEVLEELGRRGPELMSGLRERLAAGALELLGTGLYEPVLSAVPERDAVAQLQGHASLLKRGFGVRPTGAVVPRGAWDPSLPKLLAQAGLRYVLCEPVWLASAGPEAQSGRGVLRAEREGASVALLPVLPAPSEALGEAGLLARVREGSLRSGVVGLVVDLGAAGGLNALRGLLADLGPGLRLVLPSVAVAERPGGKRVYLPSSCREFGALPWERWLSRQPEAQRLHARMLGVSREVRALERAVREGAYTEARPDPELLVLATKHLYRAQHAGCYESGPGGGLRDPATRWTTWRWLLRAESTVRRALGRNEQSSAGAADIDADGLSEVVLRTRGMRVVVDPSCAGGVVELSTAQGHNLISTFSRVGEMGELEPAEVELVEAAETTVRVRVDPLELRELAAKKGIGEGVDALPRAAGVCLLLGSDVRLEDVARGRVPESASGHRDGPWELVTAESRGGEAAVAVFSTQAMVQDAGGPRRVNLTQRVAALDGSRVDVRLDVQNRTHDVLRLRVGLSFDLSLGEVPRDHRVWAVNQACAGHERCDFGEVEALWLAGSRAQVRLVPHAPARAWHVPVQTAEWLDSGPGVQVQASCVVLWWPVELWGKEKVQLSVSLQVDE